MSTKGFFDKFTYIFFGFAIAIGFLFLTGADKAIQVGRYQLSTEVRRDFVDVYVIDTATGAVKYVDSNNENKPFEEVKSR